MKLNTLGSLFSNSWKRLQERFAVAIEIFIAPLVLILISQLLLARGSGAQLVLGGVVELIAILVSCLSSIALISMFGKDTDFAGSYATGFKLFWASIWIWIIVELAVIGGLVMLIIPGIMLMFQLTFAIYALVLEGKHGMAALVQSREYLKGYWWAFVGRSLLLVLCLGVAMLVLFLPATYLGGYVFGQFVYAILLLIFVPFSIAYQYEIYSNLRSLKPEVVDGTAAAKSDTGFLKVAMVVGIVGVVAFIILFSIGIFALSSTLVKRANNVDGYQFPPVTESSTASVGTPGEGYMQISPESGPVGTIVTITSNKDIGGFDATNTILMKGLVAAREVAPSADYALSFAVPNTLAPNCDPGGMCPQFLLKVTSGNYDISILNAEGTEVIGTFTVTGAPVNPGTSAADGSD